MLVIAGEIEGSAIQHSSYSYSRLRFKSQNPKNGLQTFTHSVPQDLIPSFLPPWIPV